jgi:hypothetical protein
MITHKYDNNAMWLHVTKPSMNKITMNLGNITYFTANSYINTIYKYTYNNIKKSN